MNEPAPLFTPTTAAEHGRSGQAPPEPGSAAGTCGAARAAT